MPFRVSIPSVACGLLLVLSGCYSYPSSYGPGGPGYYGAPPGRMMGPQPAPNLGGPTPVIPEGATTPDGAWRNPTQPGATYDPLGAPPIGSDPSGGQSIDTQKNAVPDASKLDLGPNLNETLPKSSPGDEMFEKEGPGASLPRESGESFGADDSEMQFQEPIEVTPASSNGKISSSGKISATLADSQSSGPNPFDYDRKEYRHLQGTVEYVKEEKAWHLMYSAAPDAADKFGGDITLHDHVGLKGLKENDVIYVEGHVDAQSKDATGKPRYHIEHLRKLVPKQRL